MITGAMGELLGCWVFFFSFVFFRAGYVQRRHFWNRRRLVRKRHPQPPGAVARVYMRDRSVSAVVVFRPGNRYGSVQFHVFFRLV